MGSSSNNFIKNTITKNEGPGLEISPIYLTPDVLGIAQDNKVMFNCFIGNNLFGQSQAYDDGQRNIFEYNYWDDWTSPDSNADGLVDYPYLIGQNPNLTYPNKESNLNFDPFPLLISNTGSTSNTLATNSTITNTTTKKQSSGFSGIILLTTLILVMEVKRKKKK